MKTPEEFREYKALLWIYTVVWLMILLSLVFWPVATAIKWLIAFVLTAFAPRDLFQSYAGYREWYVEHDASRPHDDESRGNDDAAGRT